MYGYIYRITDLTNGKCYIGQHKYDKPMLDPTYHGSGIIIKNIFNQRPETLLEEILMICATLDEANYFERYFIERLDTLHPNGYNLVVGGKVLVGENNLMYGKHWHLSDESKKKISDTHKDKPKSEEQKQKIRKSLTGRKVSIETRKKLSQVHKNKPNSGWFSEKFIVSFDELYELYIIQQLSTLKIAKIYGVTPQSVSNKLKKYSIPVRSSLEVSTKCCVTEEELYDLYIVQGLSTLKIAKIYGCGSECIRRKLQKYNIKK